MNEITVPALLLHFLWLKDVWKQTFSVNRCGIRVKLDTGTEEEVVRSVVPELTLGCEGASVQRTGEEPFR